MPAVSVEGQFGLAPACAAGIERVTLVMLEKGDQSPKFKTLKGIAEALEMEAPDLLVEPEFLPK